MEKDSEVSFLQTAKALEELVVKYHKMIPDFDIDNFKNWDDLRELFYYRPIDWMETTVRPTNNIYVNSELINYYDISSNIMFYYLIKEMVEILAKNNNELTKTNISQMYIDIINYIYSIYNIDPYINNMDLKRYEYLLNGSYLMINTLKYSHKLDVKQEEAENEEDLEEYNLSKDQQEELEDLKEEAEALDIEGEYFGEEDADIIEE